MSEEWYVSLSVEELRCLARKEGVKQVEKHDVEELIEILEEIQEEKLADRRQNNDIMRLKGKKYDIFRETPFDGSEDQLFDLPEQYADTKITMLLRDPFWAYAYWDINHLDLIKVKEKYPELELFLRVYELQKQTDHVSDAIGNFEIPIQESDRSWYINLPNPGRCYVVDLLCDCLSDGGEILLISRSNMVESPGGYWLNHINELRESPEELELFLAGLTDNSGNIADNALIENIIAGVRAGSEINR